MSGRILQTTREIRSSASASGVMHLLAVTIGTLLPAYLAPRPAVYLARRHPAVRVAIGDPLNATKSAFENTVRSITGDEKYQFGDWTRGKVTELTGRDASEYKFGDISKRAFANFTGKEVDEYEFGDLTRAVLSKADARLAEFRDAYLDELPSVLWQQVFGNLSPAQRTAVIIVLCELFAIVMLSFGLVNGLTLGIQTVLAWSHVCRATGLSPLMPGQWGAFLETHQTLRLYLDVPSLPVRVLAGLLLAPSYRNWTVGLQRWLPGLGYPLLKRALTLATIYLLVNLAAVGGVTLLGLVTASRFAGVPVAWPLHPFALFGRGGI